MKTLVAIFMVIFSLQAVLMPGAMAAGPMDNFENSDVFLVKQEIPVAKATSLAFTETDILSQNFRSNTTPDSFCGSINCICNFLEHPNLLIQAQQTGIKNPFYLVSLAEPPTFVLPAPPRTI